MPKMRASSLWNHFNKKEGNRGECTYCKAMISIAGGSMGNLKRHLINKHSVMQLDSTVLPRSRSQYKMYADTVDLASENITETRLTPSPTIPKITIVESLSEVSEIGSLGLNESISEPSSESSESQSSLTEFVKINRPAVSKSKIIDIQLLKMICKEYHPFSIVDDPGFKQFVALLCPNYQLPSRNKLKNILLPQLYSQLRESVQTKIDLASSVALSVDGWTSVNDEDYLAITAHYIDENSNLCSSLLGCLEFTNRYTAENLANFLKEEVSIWGIKDKIVAVVTNNDANIMAAVKICKWVHIPCYAHTIDLIVKIGIKPIERIVEKVKSMVQYFNKCNFAQIKLREFQIEMNLAPSKLKQEVPKRWNSLLIMLVRVSLNKVPILSTLAVLGNEDYKLTDEDWKILEHSINILEIFDEFIKEISAERSVSLPKTEVFCRRLIGFVQKYKNNSGLPKEVLNMCEGLIKTIEERLMRYISEIIGEATFLDPRLKNRGFGSGSTKYKQVYDGVVKKIKLEILLEKQMKPTSPAHSSECGQYTVPARTSFDIWEEFDLSVAKSKQINDTKTKAISIVKENIFSPESNQKTLATIPFNIWEQFDLEVVKSKDIEDPKTMAIFEVNKFISEELLQRSKDPLLWWEQRKLVYPHLYDLALKRLCVPASSIFYNSIYSKSGQTLVDKRSRLGPSMISQKLFINGNC